MAGKREKPEEIVSKLRQVEVLQGQGMTVAEAVRQIGVMQQTFYRWRKLYGGMGRSQLARLKELEKENQRLRRAVCADSALPDTRQSRHYRPTQPPISLQVGRRLRGRGVLSSYNLDIISLFQ